MDPAKATHYEQESNHSDQHYAIPLLAFLAYNEMQAYFKEHPEQEKAESSFHSLLSTYVRTLYPADSMLPIGKNYEDLPLCRLPQF